MRRVDKSTILSELRALQVLARQFDTGIYEYYVWLEVASIIRSQKNGKWQRSLSRSDSETFVMSKESRLLL